VPSRRAGAEWPVESTALGSLLQVTAAMQAQLRALAQHAAPRECCGWVTAQTVRIADNIANSNAQFEFAAADLLAFARARDLPVDHHDYPLAIFHSHPHGPAELSDADLAAALVRIDDHMPQPSYTAHQLLIVGPTWRVLHFEFDATTPRWFRQHGATP
jgi:proteasome lid subunit RPN8/RPN11